MKKRDWIIHANKLEEQLRNRGEGRLRKTAYFILVNPNCTTADGLTDAQIKSLLADILQYLTDNIADVITFNKDGHEYTKEYIKLVRVRYAMEKGSTLNIIPILRLLRKVWLNYSNQNLSHLLAKWDLLANLV